MASLSRPSGPTGTGKACGPPMWCTGKMQQLCAKSRQNRRPAVVSCCEHSHLHEQKMLCLSSSEPSLASAAVALSRERLRRASACGAAAAGTVTIGGTSVSNLQHCIATKAGIATRCALVSSIITPLFTATTVGAVAVLSAEDPVCKPVARALAASGRALVLLVVTPLVAAAAALTLPVHNTEVPVGLEPRRSTLQLRPGED
mmetsp:Transcript_71732/g.171389  ORF Transcript_71732/g.171389 Transcript_71732/m.171389 type:complete len:202 (-) Transcript_71732:1128-1733(-)